jgi:hypothetical protein
MVNPLSIPPRSPTELTAPTILASRLTSLLGQAFRLTGKTRTDGSNLRKLVCEALAQWPLPPPAAEGAWRCVVPKRKGVPRVLRELIDTFIVTTGASYNLQVWNRNPTEPTIQIEYEGGERLRANDVRFVFVRVDPDHHVIRSVVVTTPAYIAERFGEFGKPTVKEQLIITNGVRAEICARRPPIVFYPDDPAVTPRLVSRANLADASIRDTPSQGTTLALSVIRDFVAGRLVGRRIEPGATKNRGQELERIVAMGLGYTPSDEELLVGGFPDLRHQALEVKVQGAPTVDLGRFSPQFEEDVPDCPGFTTRTIRYLIALMDSTTGLCTGAVVCPGGRLAEHFTYVADKSFKCQRSIPMGFFDRFEGQAVFNPPYP